MVARIVLVEDHFQQRQILKQFIEREQDFSVIDMAATAEETLALLNQLTPDLVLTDASLPDITGLTLTRYVKEKQPQVRCVVLSTHEHQLHYWKPDPAAADAFVSKFEPEALVPTMRKVLGDGLAYKTRMKHGEPKVPQAELR